MKLNTICPHCGKKTSLEVKREDWEQWKLGKNVQIVFPYLSPAEREMLITGICDDCWKEIFGEEDE